MYRPISTKPTRDGEGIISINVLNNRLDVSSIVGR